MEKVNGTPLYFLGNALGQLVKALTSSPTLWLATEPAIFAKQQLEVLINQFITLPLSKKAAQSIVEAMENIGKGRAAKGLPLPRQGADPTPEDYMTPEEIQPLLAAIWAFQSVLSHELPQQNIYYATPKLAYDMDILIDNGERALPQEVLDFFGASKDRVIKDIRESARCLAFGIATAVGFHIYRAIECIVVDEYFPLIGVAPSDYGKNKNLGKYIELLKGKKVDEKITVVLQHIKDEYRNPISHPEDFWDISKAGSAFGVALSVITMMLHDIESKKRAGSP